MTLLRFRVLLAYFGLIGLRTRSVLLSIALLPVLMISFDVMAHLLRIGFIVDNPDYIDFISVILGAMFGIPYFTAAFERSVLKQLARRFPEVRRRTETATRTGMRRRERGHS